MNEQHMELMKAIAQASERWPRRQGHSVGHIARIFGKSVQETTTLLNDLKELKYVRTQSRKRAGSKLPATVLYELSVKGKASLHQSGKVSSASNATSGGEDYVNPRLIEQFRIKDNKFNYTKLVGILNGLNRNYREEDPYACSQLVKALVNHIPPLLGPYRNFNDAASQFPWEKAHRPYIESIRGYVNEANDVTHTVISAFEDQASLDSLPKPIYLNTLLSVCLVESDKNSPLPSKPTKKLEAQKVNPPAAQNAPSIMLTEPEAVWASNYSSHGASFLVVVAVDNYGGRNDYIVDAKISGTNANGSPFETDRFTFEGQQPNYPYPLKADDMQTLRIFIASDHTNHRPMPDLDRDTVKLALEFRSGKVVSLPIKIRQN